MVTRCVPVGSIGISASPSQDGSTVNDEISGSNEPSFESVHNNEHKEGLMQRGSSRMATFAMLGWTHNERPSLFIQRQATG